METAKSVIESALLEIVVHSANQELDPSEFQTGVLYLNRLMAKWDADGYALGYTVVSNLSDPITVNDGVIAGIVKNLAIALAPQYGKAVPPELSRGAADGFRVIQKLSINLIPTPFPTTLPIGSGNEGFRTDRHFFPPVEPAILTEQGGFIATEENTELDDA